MRGNDKARELICEPVNAWVIPTNEELMIARHTGKLLELL